MKTSKTKFRASIILKPFKLHYIDYSLIFSIQENDFDLPEVENDRRALNVTVGMRRAKKEGRWMATAPKGYKNITNEQKWKVIVPSPDAKHIKWIFEEINKGILHADQIRKVANKKGFDVSRGYFWTMIRNPVYCGKIFIPAYKDEDALFVQGTHEPIIGEELFYNVQDLLSGRKKNIKARNTQKEELTLRGFLVCRRCDGNLTGSASKGKGGKYFYYHCQPGCPERIKAEQANDEAIKRLKEISSKKEAIRLYQIILEKKLKEQSVDSVADKQKIEIEINKNQQRINSAQQLMLDGEIQMEEYKNIKHRYEMIIKDLQGTTSSPKRSDYKKYLDFGFNILQKVDQFYISAKPAIKLQTLSSMYAEKFVFDEHKYRTPVYRDGLALILNTGNDFIENKKGQNQKKLILSSGVEPTCIKSNSFLKGIKVINDFMTSSNVNRRIN